MFAFPILNHAKANPRGGSIPSILIHVKPWKLDPVGSYKSENRRCRDGQDDWQPTPTLQHRFVKPSFAGAAYG
jgi:hypothetical protein